MRCVVIFFLILVFITGLTQTYTVETVPNTKLQTNSYVSNPDNILSEYTVSEINSLLSNLESQTQAQVAVVVINSIGDADIFDFAQNLFKHWGIGQEKEDNGLLILLVMDKRTIRLHTGYGLEGDLPDIICKHIETRKMVPLFKVQNYDEGIMEGVREVVRILSDAQYASTLYNDLNSTQSESSENTTSEKTGLFKFLVISTIVWTIIMVIVFFYNRAKGLFTNSSKFKSTEGPNIKTGSVHFLIWFLLIPLSIMVVGVSVNNVWFFLSVFYCYLVMGAVETRMRLNSVFNEYMKKKEYYALHQLYQQKLSFWYLVAVFIPVPFAFLIGPYKKRIGFLRDHPRDCGQCHQPCVKLNDQTEDPFLNKQQLFEETLKSVDYDVWKCNACNAHQVFRYPNPHTKFEDCPKCETVAYYVASTRTIRSATTTSEGLKEEVKLCKYCNFRNVRTYTIPKVSTSSSSGGGGSSGGGSWGGGSSGGGGASSSW